jgi:hypothetical protein
MTGPEIDRLRRVESIFNAALEYPPGPGRDVFLGEECAADAGMLEEVRRLLEDHARVREAAPQDPEAPSFLSKGDQRVNTAGAPSRYEARNQRGRG